MITGDWESVIGWLYWEDRYSNRRFKFIYLDGEVKYFGVGRTKKTGDIIVDCDPVELLDAYIVIDLHEMIYLKYRGDVFGQYLDQISNEHLRA